MRIGLVPVAAKPYHVGHDGLVRIAANENDEVHLYVSLSDRDSISGEGMAQVWKLIEPTLPKNVKVTYGGSPVGHVFKEVGEANKAGSPHTFTIYSDPTDAAKNYEKIDRYAGELLADGRLEVKSIDRRSTVNISGTQMREWFDADNRDQFVMYLPRSIDGDKTWDILKDAAKKALEAARKATSSKGKKKKS